MIYNSIIKLVNGSLSKEEHEEVIKFIIENPYMVEVIGGLNNVKRQLPANQDFLEYIENKKSVIWQYITPSK